MMHGPASLRLFDVLLRVCSITSIRAHSRPQLDECHDAFVAVERWIQGSGWCRIRRHGMERILHGSKFPSRATDVDVKGLKYEGFSCPVYRDGDCATGAGGRGVGGRGKGGGGERGGGREG
jgi:hypothetical protein